MARLFSLARATAVDDPEFGHFEGGEDGSFDFPDELSDRLHRFGHRGKRAWETEEERGDRLHADDLARRRDPAALYDAVGDVTDLFRQLAGARPAAPPDLSQLSPEQLAELAGAVASARAAHGTPADDKKPAAKPPARGKPAAAAKPGVTE